jgi:hypothetical protein
MSGKDFDIYDDDALTSNLNDNYDIYSDVKIDKSISVNFDPSSTFSDKVRRITVFQEANDTQRTKIKITPKLYINNSKKGNNKSEYQHDVTKHRSIQQHAKQQYTTFSTTTTNTTY